jgi:hypothetical protein
MGLETLQQPYIPVFNNLIFQFSDLIFQFTTTLYSSYIPSILRERSENSPCYMVSYMGIYKCCKEENPTPIFGVTLVSQTGPSHDNILDL